MSEATTGSRRPSPRRRRARLRRREERRARRTGRAARAEARSTPGRERSRAQHRSATPLRRARRPRASRRRSSSRRAPAGTRTPAAAPAAPSLGSGREEQEPAQGPAVGAGCVVRQVDAVRDHAVPARAAPAPANSVAARDGDSRAQPAPARRTTGSNRRYQRSLTLSMWNVPTTGHAGGVQRGEARIRQHWLVQVDEVVAATRTRRAVRLSDAGLSATRVTDPLSGKPTVRPSSNSPVCPTGASAGGGSPPRSPLPERAQQALRHASARHPVRSRSRGRRGRSRRGHRSLVPVGAKLVGSPACGAAPACRGESGRIVLDTSAIVGGG